MLTDTIQLVSNELENAVKEALNDGYSEDQILDRLVLGMTNILPSLGASIVADEGSHKMRNRYHYLLCTYVAQRALELSFEMGINEIDDMIPEFNYQSTEMH